MIKSSGNVRIWGFDQDVNPRRLHDAIGVVPQELVLDVFFTVREALELHAGYYGVPKAKRRTDEILEAMGLADKASTPPRRLSGGMRRRLLIAKALVHAPPVLILDEPTAGVDVELREQLWDYVRELNKQGTTILLTTHYLEEAEALCDSIAIINHGEVITQSSKQELMQQFDSKELVIQPAKPLGELPKGMEKLGLDMRMNDEGNLVICYPPSQYSVPDLLASLKKSKVGVADLTTRDADLEDVFRRLTYETA